MCVLKSKSTMYSFIVYSIYLCLRIASVYVKYFCTHSFFAIIYIHIYIRILCICVAWVKFSPVDMQKYVPTLFTFISIF